jgi:GDP-L-fucose synthase
MKTTMRKKKVLICGATGFIGRNVLENILKNSQWEVIAVYHKRVPFNENCLEWVQADLTQSNDVKRVLKGVDIIIQAAATTSGVKDIVNRPHIHVTNNVIMNSLLFQAAQIANVSHFIFFSCSIMYPSSPIPLKETAFNADTDIHQDYFGAGWTKVYLEKMAEFFSNIGPTRYTVIRHSNIYGPYDKFDLEYSHVFGATINKVLNCKDGEITLWGDGSEERDLLYITDLVDFIRLVIEKQSEPFCLVNIGYGSSISIINLTKKIIETAEKNIRLAYDKSKPSINTKLALDCTKAKDLFGWQPKVSLKKGIQKTIDWYKSNTLIN